VVEKRTAEEQLKAGETARRFRVLVIAPLVRPEVTAKRVKA